jgi:hypothetical protein
MLREAGALMEKLGFDFLFTGEVLGQRPMSQHKGALALVARESGYADLIVRPLSGRGRKRQMALAKDFGITDYPAPAGGCLLTDPSYAARLKELLRHKEEVSRQDLELLKWGRHFRLPGGRKVIVGRTHGENEAIAALSAEGDLVLKVQNIPGPTVLVPGDALNQEAEQVAALAAAYSDAPTGAEVAVTGEREEETKVFRLTTPPKEQFKEWLL